MQRDIQPALFGRRRFHQECGGGPDLADLAKERAPGKDEKPEDKAKLDKEFKERADKLAEKLKLEKTFEGHTYLVSKFSVDALLKDRASFIAKKEDEKKE